MGIFKKRPTVDPAIEELRTELARLTARLETSEQMRAQLENRLSALTVTTATLTETTRADTGSITDQVDLLERRVEAAELTGKIVDDLREQLDAAEQRLVALGTELGNQLGELSADIDTLSAQQLDAAALDELRTAQVRLAAEQARYEIAFRQDLAVIAEQVRQMRSRRP